MRTERTPWTCGSAEYRPALRPPMWLDEWWTQWACRAEGTPASLTGFDRCAACDRWQPRAAPAVARGAGHAGDAEGRRLARRRALWADGIDL